MTLKVLQRPKNLRENNKKRSQTHLFLLDMNGQGA